MTFYSWNGERWHPRKPPELGELGETFLCLIDFFDLKALRTFALAGLEVHA